MVEIKNDFPSDLERKIVSKINKKIKITFYGGRYITNSVFNLTILEPYKITFSCKNKIIIVFVIERVENNKRLYDFFIGSIEKRNKYTMTNLIAFVNSSIESN